MARSRVAMEAATRACWCEASRLEPFSTHYLVCVACGTLVSQAYPGPEAAGAGDDTGDFYGRDYWLSHQREKLGLPDIEDRARLDLPERCLYWLRTLLGYKLPPARTLELGSSHGAFVSLLRYAGLDALGLEVSPWVVEYSKRTFRIPVLLGPIEQQQLPPQLFDAVILNDVLEHLPDPARTLRDSVSLLKPDGMLVIQTPRYPDPEIYQDLLREDHVFLKMLLEAEHLYLFSERSLRHLLASVGCPAVTFEAALFPYDMYAVAGRHPLAATPKDAIVTALRTTPDARVVLALLDLYGQYGDSKARYAELRADRDSQIESLLKHQAQLVDQQDAIDRVAGSLEQVSVDSEARLRVIREQQATIAEQQGVIGDVTRSLEQVSADGEARLQVLLTQQATIAEQQGTVAEQQATIARQQTMLAEQQGVIGDVTRSLEQVSADGEARLQVLLSQDATIAEQQVALAEQQATIARQQTMLAEQQASLTEQQATVIEQEARLAERQAAFAEQQAKLDALEHNVFVRLLRHLKLLRNHR